MFRKLIVVLAASVLSSANLAWAGGATAQTTLILKGMTCGGCVAAVKQQLKRTEGVAAYEVSFEKGEALVSYDPSRTEPEQIAASVSQTGFEASVKARPLAAWEPVDPAFSGCSEGVCGRRGRNPQAVVQPGAKPGQTVYCPVSGAVFEVKESSPRADLNGEPLYFCCEGCARYFAQNRDRVLGLRGLASRRSAK